MGNTPIVFAPSHRSYADFILMAYVCFHYCIEIPCVAAGVGKNDYFFFLCFVSNLDSGLSFNFLNIYM